MRTHIIVYVSCIYLSLRLPPSLSNTCIMGCLSCVLCYTHITFTRSKNTHILACLLCVVQLSSHTLWLFYLVPCCFFTWSLALWKINPLRNVFFYYVFYYAHSHKSRHMYMRACKERRYGFCVICCTSTLCVGVCIHMSLNIHMHQDANRAWTHKCTIDMDTSSLLIIWLSLLFFRFYIYFHFAETWSKNVTKFWKFYQLVRGGWGWVI